MHRRDGELRRVINGLQHARHELRTLVALRRVRRFLEVEARAEHLAVPADNDDPHRGVCDGGVHRITLRLEHGNVEGVALVRPVQANRRHGLAGFGLDEVGHGE